MGLTTDVLTGLAQMLATANIGLTYRPTGLYQPAEVGVWMKRMPPTPDRCVVLHCVPRADMITLPAGELMVQVRGRGAPGVPLDVDDLLDPIFDVLHGTTNLQFGSVSVTQMNRRVSTPMGTDTQKRDERVDQYYLDYTTTPTSNRPQSGSW